MGQFQPQTVHKNLDEKLIAIRTPVYVSLKRVSVHPPRMCPNYCGGDGFCNFTDTSCKYTQCMHFSWFRILIIIIRLFGKCECSF